MKRFRLILILLALLVILAGGAAGLYFTGALDSLLGGAKPGEAAAEPPKPKEKPKPSAATGFFDLPEVLVMLDPKGGKSRSMLRMLISLQLPSAGDATRAQAYLPRLLDVCQVYLRTLSVADLRGTEQQNHIRDELLKRLSDATAPMTIDAILFREVAIE